MYIIYIESRLSEPPLYKSSTNRTAIRLSGHKTLIHFKNFTVIIKIIYRNITIHILTGNKSAKSLSCSMG